MHLLEFDRETGTVFRNKKMTCILGMNFGFIEILHTVDDKGKMVLG